MRAKRLKTFAILIGILIAFIVIYLPSLSKYQQLKQKEIEISNEIERLSDILDKRIEEEKLIENDQEYLEKVTRDNLGRVRPGEVVYKILPVNEHHRPGVVDWMVAGFGHRGGRSDCRIWLGARIVPG